MANNNQLITFEREPVNLPNGFRWFVYRQFTTSGLCKLKHLKFEDFDQCIHKWKDKNFHMFELRKGNIRMIAYCGIKSI
jgi:hypothetical protein